MIEAYPLCWPAGWPRTKTRSSAKFSRGERIYSETPGVAPRMKQRDLSVSDGVARVLSELSRMGIDREDIIISTNAPTRLDGLPKSNIGYIADVGAAVYWRIKGKDRVMAIDRYDTLADNLAAIAATLGAMRAVERHGGAQILDRAFTGFAALPAPGQTTARGWREVLELNGTPTFDEAKDRYRRLSALRHPDRGGSHEAMAELNWAWSQAQETLR